MLTSCTLAYAGKPACALADQCIGRVYDGTRGRAVVVNDGGAIRTGDAWGWLPAWLRWRLPFIPSAPGTGTASGSVSLLDATR